MKTFHFGKKKYKTFKEKEELPTFLINLTEPPEEFNTPSKPKSKQYLGPIFFGDPCKEFQPPLHELSLGAHRQGQRHTVGTFKQTIDELFYEYEEPKKPCLKVKEFHPKLKRKKPFYDPYPHKCPGTRKVPPSRVKTPTGDLGTTTSIIEGETSMEIPLCRFRYGPICRLDGEPDIEFIMPSDLREERWKHLSHTEQISHAHFPKRFVNVTVNGPNIPASITITRLQCKRTREYDAIFLKKSEEEEEKEGKVQKKTTEEEQTEAEESQMEEDMESEAQADEQSLKSDAFSTTTSQKSVDKETKEEEEDVGSGGKEGSSKMPEEVENDGEGEIENDGEGEVENDKTEEGETQEEEKTEEVKAEEEENPPDEEEGD